MIRDIKESLPAEPQEAYSPALTERVKRQAVSEIVTAGREMLIKSPRKISLSNTDQLMQVTDEYLSRCIRIGVYQRFKALRLLVAYHEE